MSVRASERLIGDVVTVTALPKSKVVKIPPKKTQKKSVSKPKGTVPPPIVRYCSLCGKSSETRKKLIAGPNNIFFLR